MRAAAFVLLLALLPLVPLASAQEGGIQLEPRATDGTPAHPGWFTLTSTLPRTTRVLLDVEAPPFLEVRVSPFWVVDAPPGEGPLVMVHVRPRDDAPEGRHEVRLLAVAKDDPTVRAEARFEHEVRDQPFRLPGMLPPILGLVEVKPEGNVTGAPGERVRFDLLVTNRDRVPHEVAILPALPTPEMRADPEATRAAYALVESVEPGPMLLQRGDTARYVATVLVPEHGAPGDQFILFWDTEVDGGRGDAMVAVTMLEVAEPALSADEALDLLAPYGLVAAGLGAGGAAVFLVRRRESWRYAFVGALLPLYTRLAKSQLLDHERRDALHRLVQENPGITLTELQRRADLQVGVLVHHLRQLERHGLVVSRKEGRHRRFHPAGRRLPEVRAEPALTDMQRKILDLLDQGPLSRGEVAHRLGLTQQGANYHLKNLERAGHLVVELEGGEWKCHRVATFDPVA